MSETVITVVKDRDGNFENASYYISELTDASGTKTYNLYKRLDVGRARFSSDPIGTYSTAQEAVAAMRADIKSEDETRRAYFDAQGRRLNSVTGQPV